MTTHYEFPGTPKGGGSGVHSGSFDTRIGRIRFIHWDVSDGKLTSIQLDLAAAGASSFEIRYPGHDDIDSTNVWMKFFDKMLDIAGPVFVLDLVEATATLHEAIGSNEARREMRAALGLL